MASCTRTSSRCRSMRSKSSCWRERRLTLIVEAGLASRSEPASGPDRKGRIRTCPRVCLPVRSSRLFRYRIRRRERRRPRGKDKDRTGFCPAQASLAPHQSGGDIRRCRCSRGTCTNLRPELPGFFAFARTWSPISYQTDRYVATPVVGTPDLPLLGTTGKSGQNGTAMPGRRMFRWERKP